jgi:uncharacterized protein (TIGR00375 family)
MKLYCDFHLHSRFSRATSESLNVESIAQAAKEKGLNIVGTGDFTHPEWFKELKEKLKFAGEGIYEANGMKFILTVEISTIFDRDKKVKKVHHVLHAPSLEVAGQINEALARYGDLSIDGRPMLRVEPAEVVEKLMEISKDILIYPAHNWTPFYGCMGSDNGFNSIAECYGEEEKNIHAIETGLSSDPVMNWRLSILDKYTLLSNSDAHSAPNLGREGNVFEINEDKISYKEINDSIIKKDNKKLSLTIEYFPEEGKYHYDGHRNCNVSLSPEEAKKYNNRCPVCGKPLVLGVLHRINELADRPYGVMPKSASKYTYAVPLIEVIAYITGKGRNTQQVKNLYSKLVKEFGNELNVLLSEDIARLREIDPKLSEAIENIREKHVNLVPGYDGVFGIVDILNKMKNAEITWKGKQSTMKDF